MDMDKLGGIVEVDETCIGGKDKNKHVSKRGKDGKHLPSKKTPIVGAIQRKGNVVARVLSRVTKQDLQKFVRETVSKRSAFSLRTNIAATSDFTEYPHQTVRHSARQYVVGAVHTNTIEGFGASLSAAWSALSTRSVPNICRLYRRISVPI